MVNACTIVARNYLTHARVLRQSFLAHHPDGNFTVLVIDDEDRALDGRTEPVKFRRLGEIGLSGRQVGQLAARYNVTELATAVKPPFLRYLLAEGRDHILYLDPDIKIYDSLEQAAQLARQHGIVFTPHITTPLPRDGRRIDDFQILASGVYNLGFIGVGRAAGPFIDWWWSKTEREALIAPEHMMFTDQRWIDFVPSFFDHHIVKDPGYNVAYWNLHERDLAWTGDRYLVNGRALKFFHFSGFSTEKPYLLSKHQGDRPRILLSERPAVSRICHEYRVELDRLGVGSQAMPYGWETLGSGLRFDQRMRRVYRAGLQAFENGKGAEPPVPFGAEDDFLAWLNEPVAVGLRPRVSRYLHAIYMERPDLQAAFPGLNGGDCHRYVEWLHRDGVLQEKIPAALMPHPVPQQGQRQSMFEPPAALQDGVNIAGYFRAELGIGEAARMLTSAVEFAGIPRSTIAYDVTDSRLTHAFQQRGDGRAPFDVNILCVNADCTTQFARDCGPEFFQGRHTIGYWFWELEQFPPTMHHAFDVVDEVWAATRFVASSINRIGRRPVHTIPLPVAAPHHSPQVTRDSLRLPSGFLFLFVFDFYSILERKNPLGLISAFTRAFRPGEGPTLVLKSINGSQRLNDLERVRAAAADHPDILVVDESYSAGQKTALLRMCDCYVSLHRSEGLGLTMAEAMALRKPVIATAYSGNLDFMTPDNSYLVDYSMSRVPAGCDPYPEHCPWAEPNLESAAVLMRRVFEARDEASVKATRARRDILTKHNVEMSAAAIRRRLDALRGARRFVVASSVSESTESVPGGTPDHVIDSALDKAAGLLTPTPSAPEGAFLRGLRLVAQKLLFRLLRPYWWQQRAVLALLLDRVREATATAVRTTAVERRQRQALESLWAALRVLQADLQQVKDLQRSETEINRTEIADHTLDIEDQTGSADRRLRGHHEGRSHRRSRRHIQRGGS